MDDKSKNKVLVIGASGLTGARVLHSLSRRKDVQVTCLLRPGSNLRDVPEGMQAVIVRGDLNDEISLQNAMAGKDGLIYVASLGFGHAEKVVHAATQAGLKKCVFTSTTAIFTKLNAASKSVRKAAELAIVNSPLNWTIIRPTMIYGRTGDRNMERLVKYLKKWRILMIPGTGKALQQPNHVDDVAGAVVAAYFSTKTSQKDYNISGKEALSFNDVVQTISAQMGKKVITLHLGAKLCIKLAQAHESFMIRMGLSPWIKAEQILRLNENKTFPHLEASYDFGYNPMDFAEGIQILIEDLNND